MSTVVEVPIGEVVDVEGAEAFLSFTPACADGNLLVVGDRDLRTHFALHIAETIWAAESDEVSVLAGNDGFVLDDVSELRAANEWVDFVYSAMEDADVDNLDELNALRVEHGLDALPYVVAFLGEERGRGDEYVALFERLLVLARAAGVAVVILGDGGPGGEFARARAFAFTGGAILVNDDGTGVVAFLDDEDGFDVPIELYYAP